MGRSLSRRLRLGGVLTGALPLLLGCGGDPEVSRPPPERVPGKTRVLLFGATSAERAPVRTAARGALRRVGADRDLLISASDDPAVFSDSSLARFDVVVFLDTAGDVLDAREEAAFERFIRAGGGFVGVHGALDTEYSWPLYGRLLGAYQRATVPGAALGVEVEASGHPAGAALGGPLTLEQPWFDLDRNPRRDSVVVLTVTEGSSGLTMGADHPVAWYREVEGGRAFTTALGGSVAAWDTPALVDHVVAAIQWAGQRVSVQHTVVSRAAKNPMALEVTPAGDVYFIERTGEVLFWSRTTGRTALAASLTVDTSAESGLLGIALSPDFATTRQLFLYWSDPPPVPPPATGPRGTNRLSRFTASADGTLDLASRVDVLGVPSERECCHEAGNLAFLPDGTLLVTTGDNTNPHEANGFAPIDEQPGRELHDAQRTAPNPFDLRGKVLRVNPDGTIPAGNLFPADGSAGRPEIYAMGARNPFRAAVDPTRGRLLFGDVGPDARLESERGPQGFDEFNVVDGPGSYGWPHCIAENLPYSDFDFATGVVGAPFSCAGQRPAVAAYDYRNTRYLPFGNAYDAEANPYVPGVNFSGRTAIAGAYLPAATAETRFPLPPEFQDSFLVMDWTRDVTASLRVTEAGEFEAMVALFPWVRTRRPIDAAVGPDGALYVLEYGTAVGGDNPDAQLSRIEHSPEGVLSPAVDVSADRLAGRAPLTVTLTALGARGTHRDDPVVDLEWDFDADGTVDAHGERATTTFTAGGVHAVSVVAVAASGARSVPAVEEIVVGNEPPTLRITSPADGSTVPSTDAVELEAVADDAEDGTGAATCDGVVWDIRLGHNSHSHPLFTIEGCVGSFFPNLGEHQPDEGLYWVIEARYTDRGGPGGEPSLTARSLVTVRVTPPAP